MLLQDLYRRVRRQERRAQSPYRVVRELDDVDDIRLVDQRFPLKERVRANSLPSALGHMPGVPRLVGGGSHEGGGQPASLEERRLENKAAGDRSCWQRKERKIRKTNHIYYYYASSTPFTTQLPGCGSTGVPGPNISDFCVQKGEAVLEAWVFTGLGWERAVEGTAHPSLDGYVCHFQDETVRWVQKKSIQTYVYRQKAQVQS